MIAQKLLVMRHAKSDWARHRGSDFERPLAERGCDDALNMALWLRDQDLVLECIQSSPAIRAAETARIVAEEFGELPIIWQPGLYLAELEELLELVANPPSACWLLIGHNPGLESLIHHCDPVSGSRLEYKKTLPCAALYGIGFDNRASLRVPGCGKILFHQRPKLLR